jgi:hypothetical protein
MSGDDLTISLFLLGTGISIGLSAIGSAGWRHQALIISMFATAGILLLAALFWPSAKSIFPPASAIIVQIGSSPVAWFALVVLALAASHMRPASGVATIPREPSASQSKTIVPDKAAPIDASGLRLATIEAQLPQNTEAILALARKHTAIQLEGLLSNYLGMKMQIQGTLQEIRPYASGKTFMVIVSDSQSNVHACLFAENMLPKLVHIPKGSKVGINGELSGASTSGITLENCELASLVVG